MQDKIKAIAEQAEDLLKNHEHEAYIEHVDQIYNDVFFQTKTLIENIGGKATSLRQDFKDYVSRNFSEESLRNTISILKTAETFINDSQPDDSFWADLHPMIKKLAKDRFDSGFYADAVVTCLKEANHIIKQYVKNKTGKELDGAPLMTTAFSVGNPVIQLADLSNETGRNIQSGYMRIFEGTMIGIRNPKSHENMNPNKTTTIHLLFQASFIFVKLEEAGLI